VIEGLLALLQGPEAGSPLALLALAASTLISEDLACVAGGVLVARGDAGFLPVALACLLGIFVGDILLVLLGRLLGKGARHHPWLSRFLRPGSLERAERWFQQHGPALLLSSRFLPGTRLPTYVAAGVLRVPWRTFLPWFALGCLVWTPLLVGVAAAAGDAALATVDEHQRGIAALVLAALCGWVVVRLTPRLLTWRGRRLLLSAWRRRVHWEFWPAWLLYLPLLPYLFGLALRHRSLTLFTAANPGMDGGGGLVGESKSRILASLAGAGDRIAAWTLIPPGPVEQRVAAARAFHAAHGGEWPLVLKPDTGERGRGVVIARDEAGVARALTEAPGPLIVQRFVPGPEYGLFYVRPPSQSRGFIFAITDKRMVEVQGDGQRSLEELILADERAVCLAPFFLARFADRLEEVLPAGTALALTELGTHCRGALFLDGGHLLTPGLEEAVDRISQNFAGFHFGRYDVRAPSVEALQKGEFQVIELNGVSSEATSMYDPRHSVWHAWRTLRRQWGLAFRIGAENRARGNQPLGLRALLTLVRSRPASEVRP
jgi:membrane protein DedA with SNARE-associated domain